MAVACSSNKWRAAVAGEVAKPPRMVIPAPAEQAG